MLDNPSETPANAHLQANCRFCDPCVIVFPLLPISVLKDVSYFLRSPLEHDGNVLADCRPSINVNSGVLLFIHFLFCPVPPCFSAFGFSSSSVGKPLHRFHLFLSLSVYFSRTQFSSTPADIHHAPLMWQFSKVIFNYASMSSVIRAETLPPTVCLRPELCECVWLSLPCVWEEIERCILVPDWKRLCVCEDIRLSLSHFRKEIAWGGVPLADSISVEGVTPTDCFGWQTKRPPMTFLSNPLSRTAKISVGVQHKQL